MASDRTGRGTGSSIYRVVQCAFEYSPGVSRCLGLPRFLLVSHCTLLAETRLDKNNRMRRREGKITGIIPMSVGKWDVRVSGDFYQSFSKQLVKRQVRRILVATKSVFELSFIALSLEFTCKPTQGDRMREQNKNTAIRRLSVIRSVQFLPP